MQIQINLKHGRLKFFTTQRVFKRSRCKYCGQIITWVEPPIGKIIPCTTSKDNKFTLHSVVCPVLSNRFNKTKKSK